MATGTFTDSTTQDLSTQVTWSSSAPGATVNASGLVTTVAVGPATISAALGAVTGSTLVTVTNAGLVSIEVTPPAPSGTTTFTVTAAALMGALVAVTVTAPTPGVEARPRDPSALLMVTLLVSLDDHVTVVVRSCVELSV